SRRRHTRFSRDWSSDVCSSDLGARGEGLSIYAFDTTTGDASHICATSSVDNPTFLSVAPDTGVIYANSEVFSWHEGTVSAYRFRSEERRVGKECRSRWARSRAQ